MPKPAFRYILPSLQFLLFVAVAMSEHRHSLIADRESNFEHFGCTVLDKYTHSPSEYDPFAYECGTFSLPNANRVEALNLPVTALAFFVMRHSARLGISQARLFYTTMAVGIPFFWYGIGLSLDCWRVRAARKELVKR